MKETQNELQNWLKRCYVPGDKRNLDNKNTIRWLIVNIEKDERNKKYHNQVVRLCKSLLIKMK